MTDHPSRRIIIDSDPGLDDALALMLCCAGDEIALEGVTVTHGNVPLEHTLANALSLTALLGADVPVHAGAARPLLRAPLNAGAVHGDNGMGGVALPPHDRTPAEGTALDFLTRTILASPGQIDLVCIGPLTNLALALRTEPRIETALRSVVLMGGSTGEGNTTPAAEFNIHADPHAARIVFESRIPKVMMGLNATHQVIARREFVARLDQIGEPVAETAVKLLRAYIPFYERVYGWDGAALHDLCTIAWLLRPDLFRLQKMTVAVETAEGGNFGRTSCDTLCRGKTAQAVDVCVAVDGPGVLDLLAGRLARY